MADYKKMYTNLFNAATDAINILQKSQQATEEIFISGDDPIVNLLHNDSEDKNKNGDQSE